ncbi:MAG: SpaH/EbpB family LPXTG-anchored major pilin [Propionibacteriaceae bacterium]|nr:SpaH/EbpB family LPXTG-anchored major pilin [Propionibacteriaceae bacterium]
MKILKYAGALLAAAALALTPLATAQAAGPEGPTDVVITKIKMTDLTGWPKTTGADGTITGADGETKYSGGQIGNITGFFGTGAVAMPGVKFTYYSVTPEQLTALMTAPANFDTVEKMAVAYPGLAGTETIATDANGQVTLEAAANGSYWVVESGYAGEGLISGSAAVPFGLVLPMMKADGTYFGTGADALYIYPKNTTGTEPEVDKDVTAEGNDSDSANVGSPVEWIIRPTLPTDIATYQKLIFTDNIDSRLDYIGEVTVTNDGTPMELDTHYTVTQPTEGSPGGTLVVTFTEAGIKLLTAGQKLQIRFKTSINETAVVGTPIPNDVTLDYTNGHGVKGEPKTVPPEKQPEVWTGGENWIKIGEGNSETKLPGAIFQLFNDLDTDTPVVWTQNMIDMNKAGIDTGLFATEAGGVYTATSATNVPAVGSNVYLRSGDQGQFQILGLQGYEPTSAAPGTTEDKANSVSHPGTYLIRELVAPEGYALRTTDVLFKVTKTSYNVLAATEMEPNPTSGAELVDNKKITIPPTGGIGTVVFTVAGLAIMGGALVGMRKRASAKA